jgi:hypothetical protein
MENPAFAKRGQVSQNQQTEAVLCEQNFGLVSQSWQRQNSI